MAKKKVGAVFVDLTAAYVNVWHCCFTCKLLRLLLEAHGQNDHGACPKLQLHPYHQERNTQKVMTPRKRHSTGIGLGPLLYNIYTYDLLTSVSQKYAYADDFAFMHSAGDQQAFDGALSQDLVTLATYLQTWRLKLSWSKTVLASFYLNNREAGCKLNVLLDRKYLSFTQKPTYLDVKLDCKLSWPCFFDILPQDLF